jgi:hypothetical protein
MSTAPSQKELLELEQNKVPGLQFLYAAASFLRCDLGAPKALLPTENRVNGDRKSLAPREEFVLKLLLKRLSSAQDVLESKFWVLLAHLIDTIPVRSLAHLLGERDFFKSLDQALGKCIASALDNEQVQESDVSSDEDSGRPTKKRKIASSSDLHDDGKQQSVPGLICQSIARLVQLAEGSAEVEEISSNAVRNVLSAMSEDAAVVTAKLLQLIAINSERPGNQRERLVGSIPATLTIWKYRRPENVTASGKSSDQYFTTHCLRPALRLIDQLTNEAIKSPESTVPVRNLERLVALHSILPLRALFLSEKAQQWKTKTATITWDDIKDLHAVLDTILLSTETELTQGDASPWILMYYSIAIRTVPRPTIRRAQLEQPWLDCLFCACAYLGESNFPRMVLDDAGHLVAESRPSSVGLGAYLEELFAVATAIGVKLSLPLLLYFMTAAVEKLPAPAAWLVMARIVEQDVNVLVPSSSLFDTRTLLDRIFEAVSFINETDDEDYALVRDGLIRPLLKGFAQARDLRGFISLWLSGLQESIRQRASGDLQDEKMHLSFVWEDNALFRDFETAVKAQTTSTLTQSSITETLQLLQEAAKRVGPTSDILSHVAITASLLSARPEDFNTTTLESILAVAASALSRRSDYQLQRWRLWRLLRLCCTTTGQSVVIDEQLRPLREKQVLLSLSTVAGIEASPQSYARDAKFREALECFHLTVLRSAKPQELDNSFFETELEHLIKLFSDVSTPKYSRSSTQNVSTDLDIASSCVGILLQYPQVLRQSKSAISRLVEAMVESMLFSKNGTSNRRMVSTVKALLLSEEISSNTELFNSCCTALMNSQDAHGKVSSSARSILMALPLQALKKSLAQKLADVLVKRIRATASSADETLADLGLLEMLMTLFSVSVTKPKKWAEFVDLAEHILNSIGSPKSEPYQTALGCLSKMFDALWGRCENDEMPQEMSEGLTRLQSRLHELIHAAGSVALKPDSQTVETSNAVLELSDVNSKALEQIATRIYSQASSLGQEKSRVLANLVDAEDLDSRGFLMMSAIICQTSANEVAQDPRLQQSLSTLATLQFALKARTAADLSLALESCKIILEKHPSTINQHTIDTHLSSITTLTSPNGIPIPSTNPSAVFNRLCTLLGLTLSRHRTRLGGRYHLLLPALQNLLKCLFFAGTSAPLPSQTKSQILFIRTLPNWLRTSTHPLPPSSTAALTRLLTTISDPTSSSLRSHKTSELTDATKKAKSLAGQYMQYLIQSYCSYSLKGRLSSASKEKLMPGLYSVLDAMDREVMRGMNGSMDSSGRAIFKSLYDEYQRFGRWDRK